MHFDPALPINARREEIRAAIEAYPVVIVCGETGSGKTTQLPKILYEMRSSRGRIGHTQPRRIAARSVAARIAEEMGTELGGLVGYKVRFTDKVGERSAIKLMTDGILLAETQGDRELRQYASLIIDEAHERSLNIDFLLGYVKRLTQKRKDLKVVITSATIDAERFSRHFDGAPVIEVSGRLYPVEVRYRPVAGDAEDTTREEEEQALADAVDELCREGPGDILVFLPGEREIRDAADTLRRKGPRGMELLPLYSRLSAAEQDRVFRPGKERRVVLATNVAETSLTVPRIRYVVDAGDARVKRYSYRNKVEMLRVEPISQAAAQQRAGRCGRVADGVCIRLYSEEDFAKRPAFTDPELLRSSLASVILRAKSLGLGEVETFPFLDPPSPRAIADGYDLLGELGAVDEQKDLTSTGQELARLPLDPRVARMLVAARDEGCLAQVRVIAAALSVQDPRQRPLERAAAADERHARFADEQSDFLSFLKLWKLQEEAGLRRVCRENFLSYPRMREWRDVHEQLKEALDWPESSVRPAQGGEIRAEGYRAIHRALLAGLLGNVGVKDEGGDAGAYVGARGIKFWVHPGSWTRKPGKWIVAAELVETTRLFARSVAAIEPRWLEDIGAHLLKRSRSDPHWEKSRGEVVALERGTLYGLPVYVNRRVPFAQHDPDRARDIFIRAALVEGDFETRAPFFAHNRRLVADIERLEHKSRRPDILVDDELIHAFYDERIPREVRGAVDFERWRRQAEAARPRLLYLAREDLMRHEAAGITTDNFPPALQLGANRYTLEYHFEPGTPRDGVTLTVPLALLNQVPAARAEWLVPGLLKEKVKALAKSMPQRLRHKLGALDEFAERFAAAVPPSDVPLAEALRRFIRNEVNLEVPLDSFRPDSAPPHLHMNFRVVDEQGRQLDMGRNLPELKRALGTLTEEILQQEAPVGEGERYTGWTLGELPELMEISRGGHTLVGYPALVDAGDAVTLQVFDSPEKARELHRAGVLRLLAIAFRDRIRDLERSLAKDVVLGPLKSDVIAAALTRTFLQDSVPTMQAQFARRLEEGRSRFNLIAQEIARTASGILAEEAALRKKLAAAAKAFPQQCEDVKQQAARLLAPGWLARTPWDRLQHFPRYLKAASMRLDKLRADPARDARLAAELAALEQPYRREAAARARHGDLGAEFQQFGWLLEELRVSLFAQELKTPVPVSLKRLAKLWQTVRR